MARNDELLSHALDILIRELDQKGLLVGMTVEEKANLKQRVFESVMQATHEDGLKPEQYHDPNIRKALTLTILSAFISMKHPEYQLNLAPLFDFKRVPEIHKGEKLEHEIKDLFKALNQLLPKDKRLSDDKLDEHLTQFLQHLNKQLKTQHLDMLAQSSALTDSFQRVLSQMLAVLFGGSNPQTGQYCVILFDPGNTAGFPDIYPGVTNAAMDDAARLDPFDPIGKETLTKINQIALGCGELLLEEGLLKPGPIPTPGPNGA